MRWRLDFGISIAQSDTETSAKWEKGCRQNWPLDGSHAKTFLLPQSCGTPIIGPSALNPLSRRVWNNLASTIWIFTLFTLHLHFSQGTSKIRGIKTAT